MRRGTWIVVAGLLAAVPACAHRRGAVAEPATPEATDSLALALALANPVVVEVVNDYEIPMEFYASGSGIYYRMGTVAQGMRGRFILRAALVVGGFVQLIATPTGYGPQIPSDRLQIVPGDTIDFRITPLLRSSIATVRP
jgi:hypothetical protein